MPLFSLPASPHAGHHSTSCGRARLHQRGAGLVEFAIVAVPILLVGLGSIEVAHWYLVRQTLNVALLEAARAGSTRHAEPNAMVEAFEHAMRPLFPATANRTPQQAIQARLHRRSQTLNGPPWRIEVLSPSRASFQDHADTAAANTKHPSLAAINNDYQLEQDQRRRAQGWPEGKGPTSNESVFQANTLVLRLRYPHEPLLPFVKLIIKSLGTDGAQYERHAMAKGYLPLNQEIAVAMQSHPISWPWPSHGKIIGPLSQQAGPTGVALKLGEAQSCEAAGCQEAAQSPSGWAADRNDSQPGSSGFQPAQEPAPAQADSLAVGPDDPACGVTLCCVGA